nr:exosome complex component RRP43-like [Rhipicephalus microplus]
MAAEFRLLQSRLHLAQRQGPYERSDGRKLNERRPTALNIGSISTADGSALVKMGCTTVVCGVKAELAEPAATAPKQGFIVPNVDLLPLCSPMFKPGPPCEQAQALSKMLLDILNSSECVNLEKLCIEEGKLSWCLNIDLTCLDYDGNMAEACILAATAALCSLTLPKVDTSDGEVNVLMEREKVDINDGPLAATFAVLADDVIVIDPTHEEECLAAETFTVVLNVDDSICGVHKPGGFALGTDQMCQHVETARKLVKDSRDLLSTALSNVTQCTA